MSETVSLIFSLLKQNINASNTLDFPAPFGPTIEVKSSKGPT